MSLPLLIILAAIAACAFMGGLLALSAWMTSRKEAEGSQSWADNGTSGGGPEGFGFAGDDCSGGGGD